MASPLAQLLASGNLDPAAYGGLQNIQLGQGLLQSGLDATPTTGWGALGRLAQTLAGSYLTNSGQSDLAKAVTAGRKSANADLMAALGGRPMLQPAVEPKPADAKPSNAPAGQPDYSKAIAGIESGGKYDLLGPVTKSGDRAYGKYQVMGANIPDWTEAAIGQAMTPQEFMDNPDVQEAVFKQRFGQYVDKYGPEGAAKAWFAGEKGMNNPNATDQLGTSVQGYADRFAKAIGQQPAVQAIDQASGGGAAPVALNAPGIPAPLSAAQPAVATGAMPAAEPAAASGGQNIDVHRLMAVLQNPYADDMTKQIAGKLLMKQFADDEFESSPQGIYNKRTGQIVTPAPEKPEFASGPQGIFNKRTGELKQGQGGESQFGDLQGPDLMAALQKSQPGLAARAQAIIEGRAPYPTSSRINSEDMLLKKLVPLIDPTFETGNSGARIKVRNEFTAGGQNTPAGMITSGNTAIQHLGELARASEKIGGVNNAWIATGPLNKANAAIEGMKNNPDLVEYNNALGRFAEEATKFYRGIGGNESDIKRALEDLGPGQSPEARMRAIRAQAELMHSKINALQDRWHQGMGPLVGDFNIVHPESQTALDFINSLNKSGESTGAAPNVAPAAPASSSPDRAAIEVEMKKRGLLK